MGGVTKPATVDFDLDDVDPTQLKSALMSLLKPKVKSVVEGVGAGPSRVVQIPKNLKYLTFPRSIDVNNAKELRVAAKECEDILSVLNSRIKILESFEKSRWG